MKRKFTFLIAAAVMLLTMVATTGEMWGQSDYSKDYTGNVTLSTTGGTNATSCVVNINSTGYNGIKAGTSNSAGAVKITVPSDTKYLHLHVAAWNNTTASLAVTPTGYSDNISLTANSGIANSTPFTFNGDASTSAYYKVITFSDALTADTDLTFTAVGGKRFVIWGVTAEAIGSTPSISADDVQMGCNAQGTSISYEIDNYVAGTMTAATEATWITNLQAEPDYEYPYMGSIEVTTTINESVSPRSATVTLTYTYNTDQTVTKDVTVTQSGNPNASGGANNPYTVAQARAAIDASTGITGVYATGIVSENVYYSETNHYITYNISSDGLTTSDQLQAFHGRNLNNTDFTSQDNIQVGDVVVIYGNLTKYNSTYEFADGNYLISLVRRPIITATPSPLVVPNYVVGTAEPEYETLTVNGSNLTANISLALNDNSNFEMSTDLTNWTSSLTLTQSEGSVTNAEVAIRMKAGLAKGNYAGTVTLTSTDAEDVVVNLSGTVTGQTYTIEQYSSPATAHGTITFEPASPVEDGTEVTLTATPADGYDFTADSWVFYKQSGQDYVVDNTIVVTNSKITMPAYNIWVDATFAVKPTYAITKVVTPANGGTVETDETAWEGKTVTVLVEKAAHYDFTSIVVSKTEDPETTIQTSGSYANGFTFTMPAYAVTVTVTFTELQDYATIPFSYDGNGSPNPVPIGMTFNSIGNYDNSPKMKFDNQGDYVIIYYHGEANKLSYTVKNNSFSGGQFDVLESVNGIDYTTVHSYSGSTLVGTMNESYQINTSSKYIKFIYTTKSSGNVALGKINIKQIATPTDSWKLDDEPIVAHTVTIGESNTFPTFVTNSDGAKTYTSTNTGVATINSTTGEITLMSAGSTTIKCATAETANYLASEKGYALTVNAGANYTVTYHVNGVTSTDEVPAGNLNLTAPQIIPGGYTYVGWTDTEIDGVTSEATYFSSYNVTANVDLYAVFSMERFDKIASVPTPGTYVIASKPGDIYKVFAGQSGDNNYGKAVDVPEITPNTVENYVVTVAATANGYSIKYGTKYLGWTTGNSLNFDTDFSENNNEWTFAMDEGNVNIITIKDPTRILKWNATNPRFACYTSAQTPVMLFKKVLVLCTTISTPTLPVDPQGEMTSDATIPAGDAYTLTDPVTVPEGITLTVNGILGNDNPANLIIEDGGQVIVNNTGVQATFKKSVSHGAAKTAANWYTISSPVNNIAPGSVTNLIQATPANYDLYYYDEATTTWFNHKAAGHAVANMTNGKGYLYWNTDGDELSFPGELNSGNIEIAVTKTGTTDLAGFNLIGNPYSHNIYKGDGTAIPNSILSAGYYTLSNAGAWTAGTDNTTAIKPGQGILVKATSAGTVTMTNTTANGAKRNNEFIKFMIANNQYEDVAYALFNEEEGLNKINHRNADIPMLYIPQDGQNYAIATMSNETQSFNLNLRVMTTGQYTLSFKAEGKYDYLHVIDRMTGEDIDMLLNGEYSFIASPSDNDARFIVKLGYNANNSVENNLFAYQNGSDIVVNGEGELQVFDVTGRMVATQHVNGVQTVNVPSQGVFIFKLNEKTQKIVVR